MAYRRIHGKGGYRRDEKVAVSAITPGMLVELTSADEVQPHSTEGGRAELIVAEEDALQGQIVTHAYEADEIVTLAIADPGSEWQMLIASGETITIGEQLISAGDGTLKALDNATSASAVAQVVAVALETSQTAAGEDGALAADTLLKVRLQQI